MVVRYFRDAGTVSSHTKANKVLLQHCVIAYSVYARNFTMYIGFDV